MSHQAGEPLNMLNWSRSRSRDQWIRRNASLRRMASAKIGKPSAGRQATRKWRGYRAARWLQVAMWLVFSAPTWMLGWNMMWFTSMDLDSVDYTSVSERQVEVKHSGQLRGVEESHPDLPDPDEPTTNSDWSELVKVKPWQGTSGHSSAMPEMSA